MPHYLVQFTYSDEAWARHFDNALLEPFMPNVGLLDGKIHGAYLSFGEYDLVLVVELPDNVSMAAVSMLTSGGMFKNVKTTPLMTMDEGTQSMERARTAARAPWESTEQDAE